MFENQFDLKFEFNFKNPIGYEPSWKDKVERWYQLDEASFLLCEAISSWQQKDLLRPFSRVIYLSEGGSNLADADFASSVTPSPSKFVYTLPNIAPSVFIQLLGWSGPILCLSPVDIQKSLKFSLKLAKNQKAVTNQNTLILYTNPCLNEHGYRVVYGAFVTS